MRDGSEITDWRRIGTVLGHAAPTPEKKPDAVDAWGELAAAKHGSAVISARDPKDVAAYPRSHRG
ncbi:hypothetical protein [Streptomyces sp. CB03234]|uniref:hypothetical protein n=1 Tax=Streptomyces sp. (strain CB03234) TaxID=1703937 RepID=UPI0009391100|nr:hypothetical protein [Streptomyces sp. CB03234]